MFGGLHVCINTGGGIGARSGDDSLIFHQIVVVWGWIHWSTWFIQPSHNGRWI